MPRPQPPPEPKPRLIDQQKRVVLPVEVLEALEVRPGDYVAFDVEGKTVRLHKVKWTVDKR